MGVGSGGAGFFAVDCGDAFADAHGSLDLDYLDFKTKRVAGDYLPAELGFLYAAEEADLALVFGEHQHRNGSRLCHHFEDKHAGNYGVFRKVSLEPEIVRFYVFERNNALPLLYLLYLVNEKERVAVGDNFLYLLYIHFHIVHLILYALSVRRIRLSRRRSRVSLRQHRRIRS